MPSCFAAPPHSASLFALRAAALAVVLSLAACGGDDNSSSADNNDASTALVIPAAPSGLGTVDSAPVPDVPAFVDTASTNVRGDACHATVDTNAGVRVLSGFLDVWQPSTLLVDADVSAEDQDGCAGFPKSAWTGIPGTSPDGVVMNAYAHAENLAFSTRTTLHRTAAQEVAAYYDDRRGKNYSVTDGMGPLTSAWRELAQQTTTINDIPADATTVKYEDAGNNTGVSGSANADFGTVISFVQSMGNDASTEPAKRFYKYARPWRWSSAVKMQATLEPAKSSTPANDGGFPSGHTAEAVRNAIAMAYVVPERYQEMLARGLELGENRIVAGMHSPLDVIGGRILGQASALGNIYAASAETRAAAYNQAQQALRAKVGASSDDAFEAYAHSDDSSSDRFADHATNQTEYRHRLTFDFEPIAATDQAAVVPKGAEVLLETRLPYLSAEQRRVVLKTTALPSGYPVLDDAEGFGRLNLFAAADGYAAFNGDVSVTMDASLGGFNRLDNWRNDISGAGKLSKAGTGTLRLSGNNAYSGGTEVSAGTLVAGSRTALGQGVVYLDDNGTLAVDATTAPLQVGRDYIQTGAAALAVTVAADANTDAAVTVAGQATLDTGSTLRVIFASTPTAGQTYTLLSADSVQGRFGHIELPEGIQATPVYSSGSVSLQIQ